MCIRFRERRPPGVGDDLCRHGKQVPRHSCAGGNGGCRSRSGSVPAGALGVYAGNTAFTGYDLSESLFSISFDLDAQSHLDGFVNGSASSNATLDFTIFQDLPDSVTGSFVDSVVGDNGNAMFQEMLSDITPGLPATAVFMKVLSPGMNVVQGDPTGTLHGGHEYELTYSADVGASALAGEVTVTGTGNAAFYLTAVPEPGTALLLASGLSSLALAVREPRAIRR